MRPEAISELRQSSDTSNPKARADDRERLERAARAELEQRAGRIVTDEEWATIRARLVDFAVLLCNWGWLIGTRDRRLDEAA